MATRIDIKRLQDFFFRSMLTGYASDNKPNKGIMPGIKSFSCAEGNLCLIDQWITSPESKYSWGQTTIWQDNKPIWHMQYGGWYQSEVIPFLKSVLSDAYQKKLWHGCRGNEIFRSPDKTLNYFNFLDSGKDGFANFSGRESIRYIETTSHGRRKKS